MRVGQDAGEVVDLDGLSRGVDLKPCAIAPEDAVEIDELLDVDADLAALHVGHGEAVGTIPREVIVALGGPWGGSEVEDLGAPVSLGVGVRGGEDIGG